MTKHTARSHFKTTLQHDSELTSCIRDAVSAGLFEQSAEWIETKLTTENNESLNLGIHLDADNGSIWLAMDAYEFGYFCNDTGMDTLYLLNLQETLKERNGQPLTHEVVAECIKHGFRELRCNNGRKPKSNPESLSKIKQCAPHLTNILNAAARATNWLNNTQKQGVAA